MAKPDPLSHARKGEVPPSVARGMDRVLSVQRPVVLAHIRMIRRFKSDATPAEVIRILERRYLAAVTGGGAAVGASAAIPGVGVGVSMALSGVETAGFLETSALFAQSIAELHGVVVDDPVRARTLVMTMMLGSGGADLIQQFATQAVGGSARPAFWGELVTSTLPFGIVSQLADRVRNAFIRRFAATTGASVVGRAIPFGIGAVIGGTGNHLLGRKVVQSSREAFGSPPATFPDSLAIVVKATGPARETTSRTRRLPLPGPIARRMHRPDERVKRMLARGDEDPPAASERVEERPAQPDASQRVEERPAQPDASRNP